MTTLTIPFVFYWISCMTCALVMIGSDYWKWRSVVLVLSGSTTHMIVCVCTPPTKVASKSDLVTRHCQILLAFGGWCCAMDFGQHILQCYSTGNIQSIH